MFDDPKKELNRLDAELRAEAYEDQLEQLQSQEIPSLDDLFEYEDDDWLTDPEAAEDTDIPIRNHANGYGTRGSDPDFRRTVYADEAAKENSAVFVEKPKKGKQKKDKQKEKQKGGVGCLPFVIFLELIGIAGMLWWWYRWMR